MYNNGGYNNNRGRYGRGYNNGGNNSNYNRGGNNSSAPKKHSGAKWVAIQKGDNAGKQGVSAWNYSRRRGMVTVLIVPWGKTHEVKAKSSGRLWQNWMAKVFFKDIGEPKLFGAMFDVAKRKFYIKELGWVVNPNAPNGGYCGTFIKK